MNRVPSLVVAASLLSGCTLAGALAGAASVSSPSPTAARPYHKDSDAKAVLIGAAFGLAVDLLVIGSLLSDADDGEFTLVSRTAPATR